MTGLRGITVDPEALRWVQEVLLWIQGRCDSSEGPFDRAERCFGGSKRYHDGFQRNCDGSKALQLFQWVSSGSERHYDGYRSVATCPVGFYTESQGCREGSQDPHDYSMRLCHRFHRNCHSSQGRCDESLGVSF